MWVLHYVGILDRYSAGSVDNRRGNYGLARSNITPKNGVVFSRHETNTGNIGLAFFLVVSLGEIII